MKPAKIWANVAVTNLQQTAKFYTALGFKPNGIHSGTDELVSFLFGEDEFVIHFFVKEILQHSIQGTLADTTKQNEIIFTLSANSRIEVDSWAKEIEPAGGTLITSPAAFGPGYYGFVFADPDGHRFNIFHM